LFRFKIFGTLQQAAGSSRRHSQPVGNLRAAETSCLEFGSSLNVVGSVSSHALGLSRGGGVEKSAWNARAGAMAAKRASLLTEVLQP
jgi:hypothetical protein